MQPATLSLVPHSHDLEDLIEKTRAYIHAAKAPATLHAYRTDFEDFARFCEEHNLAHLPATPTTVALYIADRAGILRAATINRRLTSITKAHQAAGFEASPSSSHHFVVSETLKGIRRSIGTAQQGKAPLLTTDIRRIVAACPETLSGIRDRALILVGFAGAFRRSELAAIDFTHLCFTKDGLVIDLRRSKTDQEAAGRKVGIPFGKEEITCPVRALQCWLAAFGFSSGAVFHGVNRHGKLSRRGLHRDCVGWIVKRAAGRAGLKLEPLGGHSLRAGCVTQAAMNGVSERDIVRQTGHKSTEMLARNIRIGEIFTRNAATGLGIEPMRKRASQSFQAAEVNDPVFHLPQSNDRTQANQENTMRLHQNQLCPIHRSRFCCGREAIPREKRQHQMGVRRIEDQHHPRGYRELRSNGEMRKLLDRKIAAQRGKCALCNEPFNDYGDIVPDHIHPRGMGGAWRDDHPENIQAVHWWCNGEKGSSRQ